MTTDPTLVPDIGTLIAPVRRPLGPVTGLPDIAQQF